MMFYILREEKELGAPTLCRRDKATGSSARGELNSILLLYCLGLSLIVIEKETMG